MTSFLLYRARSSVTRFGSFLEVLVTDFSYIKVAQIFGNFRYSFENIAFK